MSDKLSIQEASELTGRHPETLRRWCREEGLPCEKVRATHGHEWRIDEEELLDFLRVEVQ